MIRESKAETQARLKKEKAERDAKMADQKANRLAVEGDRKKLEAIGREIKVRVGKIDHLGGKAVDMFDSINHLLADAEKLCGPAGLTFEDFKKTYCPEFGRSWTYELLALQEGRKSLEEIRAATRKRVAKHRANVTDKSSVTSDLAERETIDFPENGGSQPVLRASAERPIEQVQAEFAVLAGEEVRPAAIAGSAEIDAEAHKAADDAIRAGETSPADDVPSEAPISSQVETLHTPDDDRPLAEKLHYHLNDVWSLCQDQNNWPHLSADQKVELRGAMTKLGYLRDLLPRLATLKPVVH